MAMVAIALVGCGDDDDEAVEEESVEEEATEEVAESGGSVTVTVGAEELTIEGEPAAGAVSVTIEGLAEGQEVDFTRVEPGTTVEATVEGLGEVTEGGAFPDFLLDNAGVNSAEATVLLDEGSYVVWTDGNTTGEGEPAFVAAELEVGPGEEGELPEADGTFVVRDYEFEVPSSAGESFTVINEGPEQFHHAILFNFGDLDEAVVEENLPAFLAGDENTPPPEPLAGIDFENLEAGGSGVFGPDGGGTFDATLEAGNTYAVVCFIQDRTGGPPHALAYNMWDTFTVS